jgi:23S rRNA pseudouridine2605 synthase
MPTQPPRSDTRPEGDRIAKLLARAGVASRREVERMIAEGRVMLDGKVVETPATILTGLRGVSVDGKPVTAAEATRLFAFHKPSGLITAERDPAGRPTIYTALRNALPKDAGRVMPVGRLDLNTEGLLLLTNDGGLKRTLELPATKVPRTYRARAFGTVSQEQLEELIEGVTIDGMRYGSINANLERSSGRNLWIEMTITEGKNREVRNVLEHLGLQVNRLIRVGYGPFHIGDLPRGQAVELTGKPVAHFLSELTGEPVPRGGVKKADRIAIAAPVKSPPPARPSAHKDAPARPALRKPAGAAPHVRKDADDARTARGKGAAGFSATRKGAETLTNAPRRGPAAPGAPRSGAGARKRPAPTRGNTPPRGPRK